MILRGEALLQILLAVQRAGLNEALGLGLYKRHRDVAEKAISLGNFLPGYLRLCRCV